ncbi:MAG: hypothetical protein HYY36_03095 [Gammaproteobacteria bacterium]|nr:hypothetical protein [Gammaproteobacteria bacterium]
MSARLIILSERRSNRLAGDYLGVLTRYGVEAASLWLYEKTGGRLDRKAFNEAIGKERRKFGL